MSDCDFSFDDYDGLPNNWENIYIEACLNFKYPEYELQYNKDDTPEEKNKLILIKEENQFFQLDVFDIKQNMKKCLYFFNDRNQQKIDFYKRLFQYFPRKDLIYPILDQYYLDKKQTYYVFEIQNPEVSEELNYSSQFKKNNSKILMSISKQLQKFFCDYLQEFDTYDIKDCFGNKNLQRLNIFQPYLKIRKNFSYQFKQLIYEYSNAEIKKPLKFCFSEFEQLQDKKIKTDKDIFDDKAIQFNQSYSGFEFQEDDDDYINKTEFPINQDSQEQIDDEYLEDDMFVQDELSEEIIPMEVEKQNISLCNSKVDKDENEESSKLIYLEQNIFIIIKKDNLLAKIKEFYSDLLKYHMEDIFVLLQQHPKYDDFEVLSYDSDYFELKCIKDNDERKLIMKKFKSFNQIQQEENFINQRASMNNNLIFTEIILLDRYSYLLIDSKYQKPTRKIYQYHNIQQLIAYSKQSHNLKLQIFKILIDISYELFNNYNIKISNIHPSKIFVVGDNFENTQTFNIIIQQVSQEQFDKQYQQLFDFCQHDNKLYKNKKATHFKILINNFLNSLNINSKEEVTQFYMDVIQHINLLTQTLSKHNLSIYGYNKLHQNDHQLHLGLIKHQQYVFSLKIRLDDYIQITSDILKQKFDNELPQIEWSLPSEQQQEFQRHFQTFESYFEKPELTKSEKQNNNQHSLILLLKNMLNICFDHNLINQNSFDIGIIQKQTFLNIYENELCKELSYLIKEISQILKIKLNTENKKIKFYFVFAKQKILILYFGDQNIFQELTKENFTFRNIERLIKTIVWGQIQNSQKEYKIFRNLQKFDNLQRLTLLLDEQNLETLLDQDQQIQLFQQNKNLLQLKLLTNKESKGFKLLIQHISQSKNINTIIVKSNFIFLTSKTKKEIQQIKLSLLKQQRLVVFKDYYFNNALQDISDFEEDIF